MAPTPPPAAGNQGAASVENAFQNLSGDLGFSAEMTSGPAKKAKKPRILVIQKIVETIATLSIVLVGIYGFDTFARSQAEPLPIPNNPIVCPLLMRWVEGYDDTQSASCPTPAYAVQDTSARMTTLEQQTAEKLASYLSLAYRIEDPTALPEVKFIRSQSTTDRPMVHDMIRQFEKLIGLTLPGGAKMICQGFTFDRESAEISSNCRVYGRTIETATTTNVTSRAAIFGFLRLVTARTSGFELLEYPVSLAIGEYSGGEPQVGSSYNAVTDLPLRLKYLPFTSSPRT